MNTFHIAPGDDLAPEAAVSVIALMAASGNGILVAVRGQTLDGNEDRLYTVCEAPHDCRENGGSRDYLWDYVPAATWLGAHKRLAREGWFAGK